VRPDHPSIQIPTNALAYAGGAFILLMMVHIVLDVAGRECLSTPIDGTLETVSFYYMVAVTFFPLAYVSHHEGHISVELFTRGLSRPRLAALEAIVWVACLAFVVAFVYETWRAAMTSYANNEMWETADDLITIWPSRFALPIGAGLMGVYMVYRIVDDILIASGRRPAGE
jgi:TRAP-type C4-dicarboxylate transport system permease small subunit